MISPFDVETMGRDIGIMLVKRIEITSNSIRNEVVMSVGSDGVNSTMARD